MENFGASLAWGVAIGASLVLGAAVAALLRLPERVAATVTAFGGGVLLAATLLCVLQRGHEARRLVVA